MLVFTAPDMVEYVKVGSAALFNQTVIFLALEILLLLSAKFSTAQQGAMMIAMNVTNWANSVGLGFEQTIIQMIGNEIGAGNIKKAKRLHVIL